MRLPFALLLAMRERRASGRRLGLYMGAIAVGVAALVAINSFRTALNESLRAESKALLGADYRLSSGRPFPDSVATSLDSLAATGVEVARVTGTLTVALAPGGATRLVQVRAVRGGYPFYSEIGTDPPGLWPRLTDGRDALVEPGLLIALDARVGDTLRIGELGFRIAGSLTKAPLEIGFRSAIAPRVFIADRWLDEAGLITFGSIVTYQAFLRMPDADALQRFEDLHHDLFTRNLVSFTSAREEAEELTEGFEWMARFLGLVALTALLLAGLAVASAVHVFVREKQTQVAVLRCIGATRRTAFYAYLLQSSTLGLAGALLGAAAGVAIQGVLPSIIGDTVPVDVPFRVYWTHVLAGIGLGVWVSIAFALLPLLSLRSVPPLQALRHSVEPDRRVDVWVVATWGLVFATVALLAIRQAPEPLAGVAYAAALVAGIALLRGVAWALTSLARRLFPRRAGFAVRQGVSGLFRPSNQTTAVILVLGFGVFMIASIWIVQTNLLDRFAIDDSATAPNIVAFDIQRDQRDDVAATLVRLGVPEPVLVPIVPARIAAINGTPSGEILSSPRIRDIEPWALRREYRNTYRAELTGSEQLVEGEWWGDDDDATRDASPTVPARVSIEEELAQSLDLQVGDRIAWDVQGVHIETMVASIRQVDWTRFETNFFVVFEPGVIDDAPQTFVTLARVPSPDMRAAIQRALVQQHPNVSTLDLSLVQETIAGVIDRVTVAIRFMAVFAAVCGTLVLAGALSAGRHQRAREAVLLRTLGASRATVRNVLLTEYIALGTLAGLAGALMSAAASWALVRFLFELPFRLPAVPILVACAGIAVLATAIGAAGNRAIFAGPPLAVLRQAD